jgi:hypothetical protein
MIVKINTALTVMVNLLKESHVRMEVIVMNTLQRQVMAIMLGSAQLSKHHEILTIAVVSIYLGAIIGLRIPRDQKFYINYHFLLLFIECSGNT